MLEKEKLVRSETIFEGRIIRVKVDTVTVASGREHTRELVEHPGGVAVVALTDTNEVLFVRQYRRPFDVILLELPAGKLEWGEESRSCGVRELTEETGATADSFVDLGECYLSPGFCNEVIHLYLARGLHMGKANPDEDEFLELYQYPLEKALGMVASGEIRDAKTVIGLYRAQAYLKENS